MSSMCDSDIPSADAGLNGMMPWELQEELHQAAKEDHAERVEQILQRLPTEYVDTLDGNGFTPLCWAAWEGSLQAARVLLEHGAEVDVRDRDGQTPLYNAAWHGHSEIVDLLLAHKASLTIADSEGDTPLMAAAERGHCEIVKTLCAAGASPVARDSAGHTAEEKARQAGHEMIAQIIHSYSLPWARWNLSNIENIRRRGIATECARAFQALKEELDKGPPPPPTPISEAAPQPAVATPLHAPQPGSVAPTSFPPTPAPRPEASPAEFATPLSCPTFATPPTSSLSSSPCAIAPAPPPDEGSDVDELELHTPRSTTTSSSVHMWKLGSGIVRCTSEQRSHLEYLQEVKRKLQQKVGAVAPAPPSPLFGAALKGDLELCKSLVMGGETVDPPSMKRCQSPAMWAAVGGHVAVVEFLVRHGASVSRQDECGYTIAFHAVQHGQTDVLKWLACNTPHRTLLIQDDEGHSLVHWAAFGGFLPTLTALVEKYYLSIYHYDHCGRNALHWAAQQGHTHVVRYLLDRFASEFPADTPHYDPAFSNARDMMGLTPLDYATSRHHTSTAELLKKCSASTPLSSLSDPRSASLLRLEYSKSRVQTSVDLRLRRTL